MPLFEAKFGPCAPLGDPRVDGFFDDSGANPPCSFHLLAIIVEAVRYYGFSAIFVCGDLLRREGYCIIEFFVIGPVGTTRRRTDISRLYRDLRIYNAYFANFDILKISFAASMSGNLRKTKCDMI